MKMENLPSRDEFNENYNKFRLKTLANQSNQPNQSFETYFSSIKSGQHEAAQNKNKLAIQKYYEISFDSDSESEAEGVSSSQESGTTDK